MSQKNQRNNQNDRGQRSHRNGHRNQCSNKKEQQQDKKVPMKYQIQKAKEANMVELKYTGIDGTVDKTKLNIFEDGNDKEFLKLVKEFQNYIDTYEIWSDEHAAYIVYKIFRRCLAGAARDLWDQINVLENADEERDELTFQTHVRELTSAILGNDALCNQKDYLKSTPKPETMTVKQWINRLKNMNSYLPLMQQDGRAITKEYLITEVISKNIHAAWVKDFKLAKLHLKCRIRDVMTDLVVIKGKSRLTRSRLRIPTKSNLKPLQDPW